MIDWLLYGQLAHELVMELYAPSLLSPGDSTLVNATIWNFGQNNESNVLLQLFIDEIEVDSLLISNFANGTSQTLSYLWTPSTEGRFNVTAYAAPVANENVTVNNVVTKMSSVRFLNDYFILEDSARWYDAGTNGINLNISADDTYTSVELPFYFPFYNDYFSTLYVSTNGWVSLGNTAPYMFESPGFPTSNKDYAYAIAPFLSDLYAIDNIFVWLTTEWVVIQYDNIDHLQVGAIGTFQVVLHADGFIEFNYLEIVFTNVATVGLNQGNGIHYNSFSFDDIIASDFSLLFFYQCPDHELEVSLDIPAFLKTGSTAIINATVTNLGLSDETNVDLRLYINNMLSNHTIIDNLSILSAYILRHSWQPIIDETYNITVFAIPLLDEGSIGNNAVTEHVYVRDISGRILYDQIHTNVFHVTDYSLLFDVLEDLGIIVEILVTGNITSTLLERYDLLICSSSELAYSGSELAAIEEYVLNGGGFLQINPTYVNIANTLTQFAGILYQAGDVESTIMTDITEHEITQGVKTIFMSFSHCDIQTKSKAIDLIRAPDGRVILACAEPAGRVVCLTPRYALHNLAPHNPGGIEFVDNLLLGVNIFAWLLRSNEPPSAPILLHPGLFINTYEFIMSWGVSIDSDGVVVEYILQMCLDSTFLYPNSIWTVNIANQIINVTEDGAYYFRVCARDNWGALSDWSNIVGFTVYTDPWLGHFLLIIGFSAMLVVGLVARFWPHSEKRRKRKL